MDTQDFDSKCAEILKAIPKHIHSRNCFRSALNHLELAEKLFPHDNSMSVFRYITAEEEAASGLIRCFQEQGYRNAEALNPRNHFHKHAVIPMFRVMVQFLEDHFGQFQSTYDLVITEENQAKALKLVVEMHINGQSIRFIPDPPLNFAFQVDDKRFSFSPQIQKLANSKGVQNIVDHIKESANLRNQLLYASPKGYPAGIEVEDKFFTAYRGRVYAMLRAYLMIQPYKDKLPFVQDSIDALLNMLGAIQFEDFHDVF